MTDFLQKRLNKRKEEGLLRTLSSFEGMEDFCSNDYLGLSKKSFNSDKHDGATGSRLISGNSKFIEDVEQELAHFFNQEAGLFFNSGYDANLGLFSSVPQKGDTIIYDEYIHASVRDGIRLSYAKNFSFKHNSLDDLEKKLQKAEGEIFVAVESIYSMGGDVAPLKQLVEICTKHNAHLVVDEAHSGGIFGDKGEGLVSSLGLDEQVFAKLITFGKAYGSHGAIVLGSNDLKNYLINFARSLIYTTALPPKSIDRIKQIIDYSKNCSERKQLWQNIEAYKAFANKNGLPFNASPIQIIPCASNEEAKTKAQRLQEKGLAVKAILSPTVPKGEERIRICLHSFNNVSTLLNEFEKVTRLNPPSREETSPLEGRLRGVTKYSNNHYNKSLKHLARKKRSEMTKAEVKIWQDLLRKKQCFGYKFLRQRTIANYIVDFYCKELNLVVEIDGYSHQIDEVKDKDEKKERKLKEMGFNLLRFSDNQVLNDFENVKRAFEIYIEKNVK